VELHHLAVTGADHVVRDRVVALRDKTFGPVVEIDEVDSTALFLCNSPELLE
jgi:hypothetical protein